MTSSPPSQPPVRYFSTFSGIGGFELAFPPDWQCVGYSEINRFAQAIYTFHFPHHQHYGDIKHINPFALPDFDLLCG